MKRQYLKYACLTAGLLGAVILPPSLRAEDPPIKPGDAPSKERRPEPTPEQKEARMQKMKDFREKMAEELGLDESQKDQLKKIEEEQREKLKALKDDTSLSQDDKRAKFEEIRKEGKEARDAVLTDEQKAKLEQFKKDHPGPGGGGPDGGHRGGPGGPWGEKGGSDKSGPAPTAPAPPAPVPTT